MLITTFSHSLAAAWTEMQPSTTWRETGLVRCDCGHLRPCRGKIKAVILAISAGNGDFGEGQVSYQVLPELNGGAVASEGMTGSIRSLPERIPRPQSGLPASNRSAASLRRHFAVAASLLTLVPVAR